MIRLLTGDCRALLPTLDAALVDACVTDPPYDLTSKVAMRRSALERRYAGTPGAVRGFMGKEWDGTGVAFDPATWEAIERVMKPGAYLLAFGGTRTFHRLTCAIEDAGFQIKDCLMWLHGQGFPKHKSLLKPAWEPVIVAKKPGAGMLNIEAGRIGTTIVESGRGGRGIRDTGIYGRINGQAEQSFSVGRWPANVCLDEEAAALLDEMSGEREAGARPAKRGVSHWGNGAGTNDGVRLSYDAGGASRFFYVAKAGSFERNKGLDGLPVRRVAQLGSDAAVNRENLDDVSARFVTEKANTHPTVKPLALMQWLVRLVAQPGQTVLDPFVGSGTTMVACDREGVNGIGIDREAEYIRIAERRTRGDAPLFASVEVA